MYGQDMGFSNWLCGGAGFMPGPMGMILAFLFWGIVIAVIFKVFQYFFSSKRTDNVAEKPNALSILKNRYAAGEISKLEFEQMKKDIA